MIIEMTRKKIKKNLLVDLCEAEPIVTYEYKTVHNINSKSYNKVYFTIFGAVH